MRAVRIEGAAARAVTGLRPNGRIAGGKTALTLATMLYRPIRTQGTNLEIRYSAYSTYNS